MRESESIKMISVPIPTAVISVLSLRIILVFIALLLITNNTEDAAKNNLICLRFTAVSLFVHSHSSWSTYLRYSSERAQPLGLTGRSSSWLNCLKKRKVWRWQRWAPWSCSSKNTTASWTRPSIWAPVILWKVRGLNLAIALASCTPSITAFQATEGRVEN